MDADRAYRLWDAMGTAGFSYAEILDVVHHRAPIPGKKRGPKPGSTRPGTQKRLEDIARAYRAGHTLQEIGECYGISRERIRQLLKKLGINGKDGGSHIKAVTNKQLRASDSYEKKHTRILNFYGCTAEEMEALNEGLQVSDPRSLAMAYRNQMRSADSRAIEWKFTFPEWVRVWVESGLLEKRGRGADCYCMSRRGDVGPYSVENVRIITHSENSREAQTHGVKHGKGACRDELDMSPRQRTAFDLYANGTRTANGISAAMGIKYPAAYQYMAKAKIKFEELYGK